MTYPTNKLFGYHYSYDRVNTEYDRIPPIKRVPGQPKQVTWDPKLGRHVIYRKS